MNAMENPYSGLLGTLRQDAKEHASPAWRLGVVKSLAPLTIECGGILLYGQDLLVNCQLLQNEEKITLRGTAGTMEAECDCDKGGKITALTVKGGEIAAAGLFGGVLTPGCQVAMLASEDCGRFVVLCKVVNV